MKKLKIFSVLLVLIFLPLLSKRVSADTFPYSTSIQGANGAAYSQAAYAPARVLTSVSFGKIADMKLIGSQLYVVDSINKCVDVMNTSGQLLQRITSPALAGPTGVAVDNLGNIYVADPIAKVVVKFDSAGKELKKFTRPKQALFGAKAPFAPTKIAVDSRGEMYLVGTGTTEGLIVLSNKGDFLGYFGGNKANQTILQKMQGIFGAGFGMKGALKNVAAAPSNVYIDSAGIVYTTTNTKDNGADFQKLNLAGQSMLTNNNGGTGGVAITTDTDNNIFELRADNTVAEFDASGDWLFAFGGTSDNGDQIGLFKNAIALSVSTDGVLYVADGETNLIHVLTPTSFATAIHAGVALINDGKYQQAKTYFKEISKKNDNFVLAYNSIANADLLQGHYYQAEEYYRVAQNKVGYSNAFWYIRQTWLNNNLGWFLLILILLVIIYNIFKQLHQRTDSFREFDKMINKVKSVKLYNELTDLPRMLRHPLDTLYSFNYEGRGTVRASNIWLGILLIEVGIYLVLTGYIFNSQITIQVNIFLILAVVALGILIFVSVNYLVASITDGEGSFRTVYISTIHSLAPVIVLIIPIVLLTNILTFNESFIITYGILIAIFWSILLLMLMVSRIHDFSLGATLKNVLLTLFAISVMLFTVYILFVLGGQLITFLKTITWEVTHRA